MNKKENDNKNMFDGNLLKDASVEMCVIFKINLNEIAMKCSKKASEVIMVYKSDNTLKSRKKIYSIKNKDCVLEIFDFSEENKSKMLSNVLMNNKYFILDTKYKPVIFIDAFVAFIGIAIIIVPDANTAEVIRRADKHNVSKEMLKSITDNSIAYKIGKFYRFIENSIFFNKNHDNIKIEKADIYAATSAVETLIGAKIRFLCDGLSNMTASSSSLLSLLIYVMAVITQNYSINKECLIEYTCSNHCSSFSMNANIDMNILYKKDIFNITLANQITELLRIVFNKYFLHDYNSRVVTKCTGIANKICSIRISLSIIYCENPGLKCEPQFSYDTPIE